MGRTATGTTAIAAGAAAAAAAVVVTNYLDARGVRAADAVGTGCSARLAGTVGVPLRCVPVRVLRDPATSPRTELPLACHA